MKKDSKKIFKLKEIGYLDLDGNKVSVAFDQKELGNFLYNNGNSIEMSDFARAIHKEAEAELNDQVVIELVPVMTGSYRYRVVEAIKDYIENLNK